MPSNKTFVFILGSHRSGTSALARFLSSMGVWLGPDLIEAKAGINDEGFWEHQGIVSINDRILACFESSWHDIRPLPDNWVESPALESLRDEARNLIANHFGNQLLAGAKDPRFCRLLPFWLPIITGLGWVPIAINGYRNIISASESLEKRDGLPKVLCQLIWLLYNAEMELNTRGVKSAFVEYDYFLDGPARMAGNLMAYFQGVDFCKPADSAAGINKALRHHVIKGDILALDLSPLELLGEEVSDNFRAPRSAEIKSRMDHIRHSVVGIASASPLLSTLAMALSGGFVRANSKMIELGSMHAHAQRVVQQRDSQLQLVYEAKKTLEKERNDIEGENARLRSEVDTLRNRLTETLEGSSGQMLEVAKNKAPSLSGQEKKLLDLQTTLEKRNAELRTTLARIRDMQMELNACNDRVSALAEENHAKETLLAASESIIRDQAGLVESRLKESQESVALADALKRDLGALSGKSGESVKRNLATLDRLASKDREISAIQLELLNYKKRTKTMEQDKKFYQEKELYFDRMLLQVTSELDEARQVATDKEVYLQNLQLDIGSLNARISELHYALSEKDTRLVVAQEKFFYLRVRFLNRLLVKFGLYKVPHE